MVQYLLIHAYSDGAIFNYMIIWIFILINFFVSFVLYFLFQLSHFFGEAPRLSAPKLLFKCCSS